MNKLLSLLLAISLPCLAQNSSINGVGSQSVTASHAYVAGGGSANAQTATYSPAVTTLQAGLQLCWLPTAANTTTTPTFSPNGLTAVVITKSGTAAVAASDLTTTAVACAIYDGAGTPHWQLQNPQTSSAGTGSNVTVNGGSSLGTANLSDSTPAAPAGGTNLKFQNSGSNVSAYCAGCVVNITPLVTGSGCTVSGYICTAASTTSTIGISSIPSGFSAIIITIRGGAASSGFDMYMRCNGDTGTNYDMSQIYEQAGTPHGAEATTTSTPQAGAIPGTSPTGARGMARIEIPDYTDTSGWKSYISHASRRDTSQAIMAVFGDDWKSTAAITSVTFGDIAGTQSFAAGTTITIQGVP